MPLPLQIISQLAFSPDFAVDQAIFAATTDDGILRSEDGGKTWQAWNFGLLDHNVLSLAISAGFTCDHTLIAGTTTGVFRSTNAGKSWRAINLDRGYAEITALTTLTDGTMFAATDEAALHRSTDSGETWSEITVPSESIVAIATENDSIAFAAEDAVYTSTDDGTTWERRGTSESAISAITFINPTTLLIGATTGAVTTITWNPSQHGQL